MSSCHLEQFPALQNSQILNQFYIFKTMHFLHQIYFVKLCGQSSLESLANFQLSLVFGSFLIGSIEKLDIRSLNNGHFLRTKYEKWVSLTHNFFIV